MCVRSSDLSAVYLGGEDVKVLDQELVLANWNLKTVKKRVVEMFD